MNEIVSTKTSGSLSIRFGDNMCYHSPKYSPYCWLLIENVSAALHHGQWHGITYSRPITKVKQSVHRNVTTQWKVAIHGKPSMYLLQNRSTSGSRNDCAVVQHMVATKQLINWKMPSITINPVWMYIKV